MKSRQVATWTCTVLVLGAVAGVLWADRAYDAEVRESQKFLESLVPHLDEHYQSKGSYPPALDAAWYEPPVPEPVEIDSAYLVRNDGQGFVLRFRDPRLDPRYWFHDVYGFSSDTRDWRHYDGY